MKFKLSAKDFKNIIERVAVVAAKKSALPILESVQIIADKKNGVVMFRATNIEAYATITANPQIVEVIEDGTAIVEINSIKKLYTVSGDVTFERNDTRFSASNGKKKNEIACYSESQNKFMPEFPNNPPRESAIMTVPDKADFIKVLENLAPCLSMIPSKPIYTGYNLNSGKYGIVAIDGYHALSFFNPWCEKGRTFDFTIPGYTYKMLKKISNVKTEINSLEVYYENGGRNVFYVGYDYVLATRIIEGDFCNFARIVENSDSFKHLLKVDSIELCAIAKEYGAVSKDKTLIHCIELNGKLATTTRTVDFRTADCMDILGGNLPEGFHILLDAKYLYDVMKTFDGADISIECGTEITPWKIYNDNYVGLVVPVKMEYDKKVDAESYVRNAFA
jgi:DNA polymerase III sliding clamp (beta) subunit (PCNA family)